jgi:phage-related protein
MQGDDVGRFVETSSVISRPLYCEEYRGLLTGKHLDAKPLRGFGGAGILEIVENHAGDTYHAAYTVRLAGRIYALHVFQKKSKGGINTAKAEIELIKSRLKRAEEEQARWLEAHEE